MSDSQINYRENYFQHPLLTTINGNQTYSNLAKLKKECKANSKSVQSTLGGGNQGHLGLVSSVLTYKCVSPGVPFDRPVLPVLPNLTKKCTDNMETFKAYNLIKRTIIQKISTAIGEDCLTDLIYNETRLLEGTVSQITKELFDTYGAITSQTLAAANAKVEAQTYNHARPIVNSNRKAHTAGDL
jgi:hypothetical protein